MEEKIQLKAIVKGNVQGVFFRDHIKRYAKSLNVVGYVKNLKDESVEIVAIADRKTIDAFIAMIEKKPGFGKIDSFEKVFSEVGSDFDDFEVLY